MLGALFVRAVLDFMHGFATKKVEIPLHLGSARAHNGWRPDLGDVELRLCSFSVLEGHYWRQCHVDLGDVVAMIDLAIQGMRFHLEFVLGICQRGDNVPAGGLQTERAAGITENPAKALSARALFDTVLGPCLGNGAGEIAAAGIRA